MKRALILANLRDGKGLARDAAVLTERLLASGWEADSVDYRDSTPGRAGRYRLGLACEVVPDEVTRNRTQTNAAATWWWVPNPEWTSPAKLARVAEFDRVLLKSAWVAGLADWGPRASVVGFEAADVGGAGREFARDPVEVLHPSGSIARGSVAVVRAWKMVQARREMPRSHLTVTSPPPMEELQREIKSSPATTAAARLGDDAYRRLQRRASVHVLASEHEGYGHSFWEGLSAGATVVATAGGWWSAAAGAFAPVRAAVHPGRDGLRMLAPRHFVDVADLADQIAAAVCAAPGYQPEARAVYDRERAAFRARFAELLEAL